MLSQDWAEMAAIAQARLAEQPAVAATLAPDLQFVHASLAYMTADANKYV